MKIKMLTLHYQTETFRQEVHPCLYIGKDRVILIDTGYPGQIVQIENQLSLHGLQIKDLTDIIITHHDHDHVGSLAAIKSANKNLKIHAHSYEASIISGLDKPLRLKQAHEYNKSLQGRDLDEGIAFIKYLQTIEPCDVDCFLENNMLIEELLVIETPGHTAGHISLFSREDSFLITGDALVITDGKLEIPFPQFALNLDDAKKSIEKIHSLSPKIICCYHGGKIQNTEELFAFSHLNK